MKLSPQQIQLLNFIQCNPLELEQKIRDELEDNPILEASASAADLKPRLKAAQKTIPASKTSGAVFWKDTNKTIIPRIIIPQLNENLLRSPLF
ncbi:MAG: hypothetical protein IPO07_12040 [Haliscomenobacter sp.]|nr:hypothetical protein [Haliscomenobacter sp.]